MKRPRFASSLSSRLLLLTVGVIMLAEALVFVPGLLRERSGWFNRHLRDAHIVALALREAPAGSIDAAARARLLALSGNEMISLRSGGSVDVILPPPRPITPKIIIDVRDETLLQAVGRALAALFREHGRQMAVIGETAWEPAVLVELLVDENGLLRVEQRYAWRVLGISLVIATITGGLIYFALVLLLVRPMGRITGSIAAFRADPERSVPLDDGRIGFASDEIALAGQELAAMQRELRAALWRNARLAALGAAVAKVSHDLRGILSPAMLAADRLSTHADPKVQRGAETVLHGIDRAIELVRQAMAYTRDGPPPLERRPVALSALLDEIAEGLPGLAVANRVAPDTEIVGDRTALSRVFGNLLRNARDAGARHLAITAVPAEKALSIEVTDDGPGLPEAVQASLFRPFTSGGRRGGSGLGLAIAHDLTRAHGGDIELVSTGPTGTVFRLQLPATVAAGEQIPAAGS